MAEDYGKEHTFTSGVTCKVLAFPALRFEKIQKKAMELFPLPKVPKKRIKAAGGDEVIEDVNSPDYVAKKKAVDKQREEWIGQRILNIAARDCLEIDVNDFEDEIKHLEADLDQEYPTNPLDRKVEFVKDYILRSPLDFINIVKITQKLMAISQEEISTQVDDIFRGEMARATGNGTQNPALMKSSHWTYSQRLRDIYVARWWGCPSISYFDELPREERINIIAAFEAQWRMDAINSHEMQKDAERKAKVPSKAKKARGRKR